jgi:hypothetical protein
MKKKILIFMIATSVVALAGWNVSRAGSEAALSDMALENVEALAQESDNNRGYPTTKTITVYYYNSSNQLERTETYTVPCCAQGSYCCSYSSCES